MSTFAQVSKLLGSSTAAMVGAVLVPGVAFAAAQPELRNVFDPEALERGAKALREIQNNPFGKQALELSKQQEITKQAEARKAEEEARAQVARAQGDMERVRWEEQRKTMQEQAKTKAQLAEYEDQLARKRSEGEHEKQRQRQVELVKLQEESARRQEQEKLRIAAQIEQERRRTEEIRAMKEVEIQRAKALAEAEGKSKEHRENEDIYRRELLLKLEQYRTTTLSAIQEIMGSLGRGITDLLTDRQKLGNTLMLLTVGAAGIYGTREVARALGKQLETILGTPSLVRETSRGRPFLLGGAKRGQAASPSQVTDIAKGFSDIILPPSVFDHVRKLAASTANTKKHGAPFRHMLFYGPPGTGKTLAAKKLARTSGLDYAVMTGGDVAPLGGAAVTQLHSVFDWAEKSPRGLLLFIDEADAFLGRRNEQQSEGLRSTLNALLYRTGDQSRDFVVVMATNRPGDLDKAVLDRMDEQVEFPLPGAEERLRMIKLYLDKYIVKAGTPEGEGGAGASGGVLQMVGNRLKGRSVEPKPIEIKGLSEEDLKWAAERTETFSGRELAKLLAGVQGAVYGSHEAVLTPELFRGVVEQRIAQHKMRGTFEAEAEGGKRVSYV